MQFSVIVTIYNLEEWVHRCVQSILIQTYSDFEIILVDDGSIDGSSRICDEYGHTYKEKIRVVHKQNEGLSEARNIAINQAQGSYLLFIDGDDYITPSALMSLKKIIDEKKPEVILSEGMYAVDEDGLCHLQRKYSSSHFDNISGEEALLRTTEKGPNWSACGKCYNTSFWKRNHFSFPKGRNWEDMQLIDRVVIRSKRVCMVPAFYCYQYRHGSITHSIQAKDIEDILLTISDWEKYLDISNISNELKERIQGLHAGIFYKTVMGYMYLIEKDKQDEMIEKSRNYIYLLKTGKNMSGRIIFLLIKIIGFENTSFILSMRKKYKKYKGRKT